MPNSDTKINSGTIQFLSRIGTREMKISLKYEKWDFESDILALELD